MSHDYVARARALLGARFRAQGREPRLGLDCIGLIVRTYDLPCAEVRSDYRLRGDYQELIKTGLHPYFRRVSPRSMRCGDCMLLRVSPDQLHLAVWCGESFIHAHAGIGRAVETPGTPPWQVVGIFRRRRIAKV